MTMPPKTIAIIGGGPAGLMAAEMLGASGHRVTVYDGRPSFGRKFLLAGRGGLNLTHSEDFETFLTRYADAADTLHPILSAFPPDALRAWCHGLGIETFTGTSGRVFPTSFKASPVLRAWLHRLETYSVIFKTHHQWQGWDDNDNLIFHHTTTNETISIKTDAVLLALGGASWPRLGSDGSWVTILQNQSIPITPLQPSNCGFHTTWSDDFCTRFAGQPLTRVTLSLGPQSAQGAIIITETGIEGGPVYALSAPIRRAIDDNGAAIVHIDLQPHRAHAQLTEKLSSPRRGLSFSNYLRKTIGLSPLAFRLLMEHPHRTTLAALSPTDLADCLKAYPLTLSAPFAIDRAISTAGGVALHAVNDGLMLKTKPGVFIAGEMLDWEAPTGGYLLQACFATAHTAARGIEHYLQNNP